MLTQLKEERYHFEVSSDLRHRHKINVLYILCTEKIKHMVKAKKLKIKNKRKQTQNQVTSSLSSFKNSRVKGGGTKMSGGGGC